MELKEYLEEYKSLTLQLIEINKRDEKINLLIKQREDILEKISKLKYTKEEINELERSLGLLELEEKLKALFETEKVQVKKEIDNLKKMRVAQRNYGGLENKSRIFSKTI